MMKSNSSTKTTPFTLAIRFRPKAAGLLTDFANTHVEDYERFEYKWVGETAHGWMGGRESFDKTQRDVRSIWEGKAAGYEDQLVANGLGLLIPRPEYQDSSLGSLIHVSWRERTLWAAKRDLNDLVWLTLLFYSDRLAVCGNRENECPTPYFIKKKANQKFCSDACALPAQREFKRQWFREHGDEWRKKWLRKRKSGRKTNKRR